MNKNIIIVSILLSLFLIISGQILAIEPMGHTEDNGVYVYDEEGNYIFATAMGISQGDKYISEDNIEYVVEEVNGKRAIAKKEGNVDLLESFGTEVTSLTPLAAEGKKLIGIYFTHNDESYLPGPANVNGQGQVHQVGNALKAVMEKKGVRVDQMNNLHLPHDGAAYERSRATATDIVKKQPDAVFDIHRDAIPRKEEYLKTVAGQQISQIRLVVGRQNPNRKVNDKFARQLKAIADQQYPGLIKGIFYGRGNYNQQLSPRALLLEFGTHVTTEEQAAASSRMLADSIYQLLYGSESKPATNRQGRSAFSTIGWIIGIVIVGLLAFLFINEGSYSGVIDRVKKFFGREIIDRGDRE